ncbi:MAG: aldehyde dehydrogenase family protein, partial [Mycobacterium sp.]
MTTETTANIASATAAPAPDVATHSEIPKIVAHLRETFATGKTRSVEWRRSQLRAIEKLMVENEADIAAALEKDLCRKPFEAWLADIANTVGEARYAAKNVKKWMRRKHRLLEAAQLPGRGWIEYEPYGTVLIIGAWN